MNLGYHLRRNARLTPNKACIIDRGQTVTWQQLDEVSDRLAATLQAWGLEKGARILTFMDNGTVPLVVYAAAVKYGFVLSPLNFRLTARELHQAVEDAEPSLILYDSGLAEVVDQVLSDLPQIAIVKVDMAASLGSSLGLPTELLQVNEPPAQVAVAEEDLAILIFTSGTTARAKGVCLTHGHQLVHAPIAAVEYELSELSRSLIAYPYSSAAAWSLSIVPSMMLGATVIVESAREFRAVTFLQCLAGNQVSHTNMVPTQLIRVLEYPDLTDFDLSHLVTIGYGSAPLPPDRVRRSLELFGPILVQVYGMSELCSIGTMLSKNAHKEAVDGDESRLASCGRASYSIEVDVVSDDGSPVARGEIGEVRFRGPYVSDHYWRNPEATSAAFRDGWLYSGDLARMDETGFLYIVDRKNDMILSGGANVASKEVEDVLCAHPDVLECAVVGVPDDEWGERVHAFVVLRDGAPSDEGNLAAWCREELADYKRPRSFDMRSELPKNSTGKILKNRLRQGAIA